MLRDLNCENVAPPQLPSPDMLINKEFSILISKGKATNARCKLVEL